MNPNKRLRLAEEKFDAAQIAYDNVQYQQAADLWLESAELFKSLKGEELNYANCLENAANGLDKLGNYNQARKLLEIVLPIQKKLLGSNHVEVANILDSLAISYSKLGEYKKAKELHEKVLAIREKILPFDHSDIAKSLHNLAIIYKNLSEHEKAIELHEKALTIWKKTLPSEHPDIAASLNNLGEVYKAQGDIKKAEEYYQRAENTIKKTFDENHPTVKRISENYLELQQEIEKLRKKDIEQRIALEEAKKLSYLGYMATGIAHNINNPVGIIRLAAQNALYSLEQNNTNNETGKEFFEDILIEANRLHDIIQKFRNFTNGDRKPQENVFLEEKNYNGE